MPKPINSDDIKLARKQWKQCDEAEHDQRERIVKAKQFRALDQWPTALKIAREGGNAIAGLPPMPARPCLVVDRLNQPLRTVANQIKNADFAITVKPNGGGADTETADIIQGALRRLQNQARDESPIEWAADGAIEGGIGWFRLRTEFVHTDWQGDINDPAVFDQELRLERLTNNLSVYCDPWSVHPTRANARFMFVTDDRDRESLKDEYGKDLDLKSLDDFTATGDTKMADWVTTETIRLAEWWRCEYQDRPLTWLKNGRVVEGIKTGADVRMTRVMRVPHVTCQIITATQVLKSYEWLGLRIPLFPVLGEELNIDGQVHLRGIIEPGMDAQRMVNYTYSAGIEIFALAGRKAPRIPGAAVQNFKAYWQTRTIYNHAYLPYDVYDDQGRELPPPMDDTSEPPIQAAVALMQTSEEAIKSSTNTGDAALGNTNPSERSGKALAQLQAQSDLANSNYPDNVKRALIAAGNEAVYVLPRLMRPGQILHILGLDDEPQQVMVGHPFKAGPNGMPEAAPSDVTKEIAQMQGSLYKFYDLNNGTYTATVTMGKASATKREEGAAALGDLIPHLSPEMQQAVMPDYVEQLSFPGAQKIADKLRKALPPNLQEQTTPQSPEAMAAQIQQLQSQIAQLQPMANDNQAKMEIEKLKQAGEDQRKGADHAFQIKLREIDNAAKIEIARIAAAKEASNIAAEAAEERLSTGIALDHAAEQAALDRAHDVGLAAHGAAVGAQAADQAHDQALEQGQASRDAVMAQQAHAAALQPAPAQQQEA